MYVHEKMYTHNFYAERMARKRFIKKNKRRKEKAIHVCEVCNNSKIMLHAVCEAGRETNLFANLSKPQMKYFPFEIEFLPFPIPHVPRERRVSRRRLVGGAVVSSCCEKRSSH